MPKICYKPDLLYVGEFSNETELILVSKLALSGNSA